MMMGRNGKHYKTDSQLVEQIRLGNEKAFEKVFFKNYKPLCSFALKITKSSELARDSVQEVFFKIWKNRQEFEIEYSLSAYLYRAVRNQALNILEKEQSRQKKFELFYLEEFGENRFESAPQVYSISANKLPDRMQRIWKLIETMPPQQRLVFELHRKHGLSYHEISKVLDIACKTVENHKLRALKYLRENLERDQFLS